VVLSVFVFLWSLVLFVPADVTRSASHATFQDLRLPDDVVYSSMQHCSETRGGGRKGHGGRQDISVTTHHGLRRIVSHKRFFCKGEPPFEMRHLVTLLSRTLFFVSPFLLCVEHPFLNIFPAFEEMAPQFKCANNGDNLAYILSPLRGVCFKSPRITGFPQKLPYLANFKNVTSRDLCSLNP